MPMFADPATWWSVSPCAVRSSEFRCRRHRRENTPFPPLRLVRTSCSLRHLGQTAAPAGLLAEELVPLQVWVTEHDRRVLHVDEGPWGGGGLGGPIWLGWPGIVSSLSLMRGRELCHGGYGRHRGG